MCPTSPPNKATAISCTLGLALETEVFPGLQWYLDHWI